MIKSLEEKSYNKLAYPFNLVALFAKWIFLNFNKYSLECNHIKTEVKILY